MERRQPNLTIKLASALLQMVRPDENGAFVPVIPYEEAKTLSAKEIIARFQFDHWPIPHNGGGPVEPWNLMPRPIAEHAVKTTGRAGQSRLCDQANGDTSKAAKVKRISEDQDQFRARLLAKSEGREPPQAPRFKRKIPTRPFPRKAKSYA